MRRISARSIDMVSPFRDGLSTAREELVLLEEQRRDLEARMAALKERFRRSQPNRSWAQTVSTAVCFTILLWLGGRLVMAVAEAARAHAKVSTWPIVLREAAFGETQRLAKAAKLSWAHSQYTGARPCPSIADLIQARQLAPMTAVDPWGRPYEIVCSGDELPWVYSHGEDGVAHTADDIASDMPRSNLETLDELAR